MTDVTQELPIVVEPPPPATAGPLGWLRANLFSNVFNTILTIPPIIRWALFDAIWTAPNSRACRGAGACWAFIHEKLRFILFGTFPYEEQWRPLLAVVIFIALIVASCDRRLWGRSLVFLWLLGLVRSE